MSSEQEAAGDEKARDHASNDETPSETSGSTPLGREDFVMQVINSQNRLYAYVLSLMFDRDRAKDILQQTNLVLLEKEADYEPGSNFFAWSARVAYYEVLADRRRRQRDRHLFSDELLGLVATEAMNVSEFSEERVDALRECLTQLSPEHRELLMQRYRPEGSVSSLAKSLFKTPGAVSAILHRLRSNLLDCVQRKLRSLPQS